MQTTYELRIHSTHVTNGVSTDHIDYSYHACHKAALKKARAALVLSKPYNTGAMIRVERY